MTLPYLIWLDDPQDPIGDADLYPLDHDDLVMSCKRIRARDVTPSLVVELENPGFDLWLPGQQRACALVESDDGTMATARILGRGIVRTRPQNVTGDTLTVNVELCLDADPLAAAKEAVATAIMGVPLPSEYDPDGTLVDTEPTAEQLPYLDRLFPRPARYADAIGLTRHGYFAFDPVTHAVSWVDHAHAKRTINLGDAYDIASLQFPTNAGPVREVRCKLVCGFTLSVAGTCDVGSWVGPVLSLTGYGGNAQVSMSANVGWTVGSPTVRIVTAERISLETGRVWKGRYRPVHYEQRVTNPQTGATSTVTRYGPEEERTHRETKDLDVKRVIFGSWPVTYAWSQQIRETMTMVLRGGVQDGALAVKDFLDLGTITISDPHGIEGLSGVQAYQEGQTYDLDALVTLGGGIYRASVPGLSAFWVTRRVGRYSAKRDTVERDPRWVDTGFRAPLESTSAREFLTTPRGQAVVAGQFLRMRVEWLDRLQSWTVSFTALRSDLPDVDLDDLVRITVPGRQGTTEFKAIVGRVMRVEETWHGDEGETVDLTLAIPLGDGSNAPARAGRVGAYVSPGYVDPEYVEQDAEHATAGPDVEWSWQADDLVLSVEPDALPLPSYSVRSYAKSGQVGDQVVAFKRAALAGLAPEGLDNLPPTNVALGMLPLLQQPVVDRAMRAVGDVTVCPRGMNLSGPGEP